MLTVEVLHTKVDYVVPGESAVLYFVYFLLLKIWT